MHDPVPPAIQRIDHAPGSGIRRCARCDARFEVAPGTAHADCPACRGSASRVARPQPLAGAALREAWRRRAEEGTARRGEVVAMLSAAGINRTAMARALRAGMDARGVVMEYRGQGIQREREVRRRLDAAILAMVARGAPVEAAVAAWDACARTVESAWPEIIVRLAPRE